MANIEDAISSPIDLPSAIARYQDVLRYSHSKVNFAFGIGLYMAPSNMELQIGTIQDYNNEIVIAGPGQKLGINNGINDATPSQPVQDMEGPTARPAQTDVHEQAAEPPQPVQGPTARPTVHEQAAKPGDTLNEPARRDPVAPAAPSSASQNHEDEKTALVVGGVAVGLLALWLFR